MNFYMIEVENIDFARNSPNWKSSTSSLSGERICPHGRSDVTAQHIFTWARPRISRAFQAYPTGGNLAAVHKFLRLEPAFGRNEIRPSTCPALGQAFRHFRRENFPELETFSASDTPIENIDALAECKKLKSLDLSGTKIKDIKALSGLTQLTSVYLAKTEVKDIAPLANAADLWSLDISGTKVKSLAPLQKLTKLSSITVSKGFSKGELNKLKKNNPTLEVNER
jgi:Leucine-rich repeat (LRR) protein